jgi:CubicO group peptidase (beta-lactamase class C family)
MALTVALTAPLQSSLKRGRLDEAAGLVQKFVDAGRLHAAVLHVRQGGYTLRRAFGEAKTPDAIFLLASITKPMTAVGMMILADRGELTLSDPVHKFIPEFTEADRIDHLAGQGVEGYSHQPGFGSGFRVGGVAGRGARTCREAKLSPCLGPALRHILSPNEH